MGASNLQELEDLLNNAATGLEKLGSRKMFGCYALWANENVFGLVWKHGRIGVKLPDEKSYRTLLDETGATPWKAGPMTMAHWVLVPEGYHSKPSELKKWIKLAHKLCFDLPAKIPEKKKTATKTKKKKG